MNLIRLDKNERAVLRIIREQGNCPSVFPMHKFAACVNSLERKGLVKGAWASGHELVGARLTAQGEEYLMLNPGLRNPIDWKWIITTGIALVAAIAAIVALFVACSSK